jgi:hypothetical protein
MILWDLDIFIYEKKKGVIYSFLHAQKKTNNHINKDKRRLWQFVDGTKVLSFEVEEGLEGSRKDVLPRMSDIDRMVVWNFHKGMKLFMFEWVEWTGGENSHAWRGLDEALCVCVCVGAFENCWMFALIRIV